MIKNIDADGDGLVSKKELKVYFAKMFPGAFFEKVWDELDVDGSGSLTTKELAAHFGMAHVVQVRLLPPSRPKSKEQSAKSIKRHRKIGLFACSLVWL